MPLPSVEKFGAKRCIAKNRKSGLQCGNPASWGCRTCRYHGARKSKNATSGEVHYRYVSGESTKKAKAERSAKSVMFRYLTDLGNHCNMFYKQLKTRGRPPSGYAQLDLTDPEQLAIAILKTLATK